MAKAQTGKFHPSHPEKYKGDPTNIVFRSMWEYKAMQKFDENPAIVSWSSEEIVIPYYDPLTSRNRRYFPDFYIKMLRQDGKFSEMVVEVKPEKEQSLPKSGKGRNKTTVQLQTLTYIKNRQKWKAAVQWCKKRGYAFHVMALVKTHLTESWKQSARVTDDGEVIWFENKKG